MDILLGKITQHAMNYAIRSGIGITATYAISQTSRLLKTVDNTADYQELHDLQERLDGKIRIISPAIDMIELISARGNTTLDSAVTLTRGLRWEIQALGIRLAKAAGAEESARKSSKEKSRMAHEAEIRAIVKDVKKLLSRIEDAVPLISLAITTSGANLSTTLPASVSPSRLLQASTLLTAGDAEYSMNPNAPVQVGTTFTLSLYMLFAGHSYRAYDDAESMRDMTWKEVIHKARLKLMRIPLRSAYSSADVKNGVLPGEESVSEFAYQLEIIEDLDDDRVHSFEDDEPQPGPYGDIRLAGIRELLPVHQISRIFYADTGKILNIGNEGEGNSPILLLKRDIYALPPRRMMQSVEEDGFYEETEDDLPLAKVDDDSQDNIDQQLRQESSVHVQGNSLPLSPSISDSIWRLPPNLDPEWLAFEVYTEEEETSSEEEQELNDDSAYESHRPSSSGEEVTQSNLAEDLSSLNLNPTLSSPSHYTTSTQRFSPPTLTPPPVIHSKVSPFGPVRSALSLLEMLIRLTALQQYQQASHLSVPDELLTFFLEESSTTGAGGDGEQRRRTRREARRKVGFDPYDESPIKRRGEEYQYQGHKEQDSYSRDGTPYDYENQARSPYPTSSPRWSREHSMTPQGGSSEPWLLRTRRAPPSPSSPISPYGNRIIARPLDQLQQERRNGKLGSPLGRGMSADTDSSLGTSPLQVTSQIDRGGDI
ncbi:hypothetical protein B7494_g2356 [Chlorociboria aeruginascens]|nr:hypothetical protein B7494_g2356 [Chlorociboria aeruginascens]